MTAYAQFNVGVFVLALLSLFAFTTTMQDRLECGVTSACVVLLAYPWDFFAIELGIWRYPTDPGPLLYQVPLNDLWFMFSCSLITTSVLIKFVLSPVRSRHEQTKSKDGGNETPNHDARGRTR